MTTVLFRFLLVYGRTILVLQFFFINLPLKLFNFNFMFFFPKKYFDSEKNLAGQEKKIYSDLTFSTRLLPILDLIIPPVPEGGGGYTVLPLSVSPSKIFFVTFFSATIDGRNLIFGHKLHIGMPYRGNHQIPTSCLPT